MSTSPSPADPPSPAQPGPSASPLIAGGPTLPRWSSQVLLAGGREVAISHADAVYRLRLTALGKLILTK